MDMSTDRAPGDAPTASDSSLTADFDVDLMAAMSPLDPAESSDLHRAINERRAQLENAEMLRRLRSL